MRLSEELASLREGVEAFDRALASSRPVVTT
jgi:hypothetical protein